LADDVVSSHPTPVISRSEAKAAGLKHYFTGKPCHEGHIDKRQTTNGRCAECARVMARLWHHEHRDACIARTRAWKQANADKLKEQDRRFREENREFIAERQRKWREKNPGYDIRKSNEYHERNPGRRKVYRLRRIAKLRNVEGMSTPEEINAIYERQKGKCAICKTPVGLNFHVDHIMPIALGGTSWPSNLQVTCPKCNWSKKGADPIQHMQSLGYLL
jgi:hypothetical protein